VKWREKGCDSLILVVTFCEMGCHCRAKSREKTVGCGILSGNGSAEDENKHLREFRHLHAVPFYTVIFT